MNTMLKNSVSLSSFYIQNPIETYDGVGGNIELLLPFQEYAETSTVSLGIPITIGTFYNDPTLVGAPEEKFIELNELNICLTEVSKWSSISYRGIEFKIPLKDFESLITHKAIALVAKDTRYMEYVEVIYDYDFAYEFLIEFALNYD